MFDKFAALRALPPSPKPAPITYRRNLTGVLIYQGEAMQAHLEGFGERAGNALLAGVLELIDDGTGKSGAVVVYDANMDGDGRPLRFSLVTGELVDSSETNKTLLSEHITKKRGFRLNELARARLSILQPSSEPRPDNRVIAQSAAVSVGLTKQPHETQEAYERRLTRNGFKAPVPKKEIEAREVAWQKQMRDNANDGTQGTEKPNEPYLAPAKPNHKPRPSDTEIAASHKKNAFSAGQEKKALANGPRVVDGPRK